MISISSPQHIWISTLWVILAIIISWILTQRQDYKVPKQRIVKRKRWIRKGSQIIILISLLLLPLGLQYSKQDKKNFIIIWDSSLSMHSEDIYPTRYQVMNKLIGTVKKRYTIKQCFSQWILDICEDTIVIPNSWSSVSDLLAVAMYSSSDSQALDKYNFLVVSDWGINNGIDFDSLFISWKSYESIYRVDIIPNETISISWSVVAHQQLLQEYPPIGKNYMRSTKNDTMMDIRNNIESLVSEKEWMKSIDPYLIIIILSGLSFLWAGHLFSILKNQPSIKRSE